MGANCAKGGLKDVDLGLDYKQLEKMPNNINVGGNE